MSKWISHFNILLHVPAPMVISSNAIRLDVYVVGPCLASKARASK